MIDDDTLEIGVNEKKSKIGKIFNWLFDFYLCFFVTIGGIFCIQLGFTYPKYGIPAFLFSVVVTLIANS